ncbi:MAG TPA: response regulator [Polyangiaceae bacterium]|nr:response regulator [Polyangiaceae bacterium]
MKGTVLLVEDEPDARELLAKAIERAGWRCVVAADVLSAMERAEEAELLDVVVTDVVLGRDDRGGLRVLTNLRAKDPRVPVVVITAHADPANVQSVFNQGASYLLEKPFRATELVSVIERVQRAELFRFVCTTGLE